MLRSTAQSLAWMATSVALFVLSNFLWWPLVFVSATPLAVGFCRQTRLWPTVAWAALTGWLIWYFIQYPVWTYSHGGVMLLALFQGATLIPVALAARLAWRRWRLPLTVGWPLVWVGGEYLRTLGLVGIPLGSLAGTCWEQLPLIQVAELGGIFALSLPIAAVQGLVADLILSALESGSLRASLQRHRHYLVGCAALWTLLPAWGQWRQHNIAAGLQEGPRVAVIQPDVLEPRTNTPGYDPALLLRRLQELTTAALDSSPAPVDLIVWPENITGLPIENRAYYDAPFDPRMSWPGVQPADAPHVWDHTRQQLRARSTTFAHWAQSLPAPLIVGMVDRHPAPPTSPQPFIAYNVARIFGDPVQPDSETSTQRKIRLFVGGESFPWAGNALDRWMSARHWLPDLFGVEDALQPGTTRTVRALSAPRAGAAPDLAHRYLINLCSELLLPHSSQVIGPRPAGFGKPFGFLVNIANEGSFLRNRTQIQHFRYLVFRAVESRVAVARSTNTGLSGFISPTGEVYGLVTNAAGQARTDLGAPELPLIEEILAFRAQHEAELATDPALRAELQRRIAAVETLRREAGVEGFSVAPLRISPVETLYHRAGDWIGLPAAVGLTGLSMAALFPTFREPTASSSLT